MRAFRTFIVSILSALIVVVLAVFAVQNLQGVRAQFVGATFTPGVWWISIGSAALGFILALLILAPGRIASGWRARALSRERLRREQELSILRQEHESLVAQHAHLQAEREGLQTERDQLRARLSAPNQVPAAATTTTHPVDVDSGGSMPYRAEDETYAEAAAARADGVQPGGAYSNGNGAYSDGAQQVAQPATRTDTAAPVGEGRQLGLGGRLRGVFSRPREEATQNGQGWNNDQPPVPTA